MLERKRRREAKTTEVKSKDVSGSARRRNKKGKI